MFLVKHYTILLLSFFDLGFKARQDYFTHFEPSQLLGGAKTGNPRESVSISLLPCKCCYKIN